MTVQMLRTMVRKDAIRPAFLPAHLEDPGATAAYAALIMPVLRA